MPDDNTTPDPTPTPNTRVLANGAIYDLDRGRIVANPPGGPTTRIQSQSQAVALQQRRVELARRAVERGMSQADARWISPMDAVAAMTTAQTRLALSGDGRASTEAYKAVLGAAGYLDRQAAQPQPAGARIELGLDAVRMLVDALMRERAVRDTGSDTGTSGE